MRLIQLRLEEVGVKKGERAKEQGLFRRQYKEPFHVEGGGFV
jgi:hypothetical protein